MSVGPYSYILWYETQAQFDWIVGAFEKRGYDLPNYPAGSWSDGDLEIITQGKPLPVIVFGTERGMGGLKTERHHIGSDADINKLIHRLDTFNVYSTEDGIRELMEERPLGNDSIGGGNRRANAYAHKQWDGGSWEPR